MLEEGRRDSGLAVPSASEIYGPAPTRVGTQQQANPYFSYRHWVVNLATTPNKQQQQVGSTRRPHTTTNLAAAEYGGSSLKWGQLGDPTIQQVWSTWRPHSLNSLPSWAHAQHFSFTGTFLPIAFWAIGPRPQQLSLSGTYGQLG